MAAGGNNGMRRVRKYLDDVPDIRAKINTKLKEILDTNQNVSIIQILISSLTRERIITIEELPLDLFDIFSSLEPRTHREALMHIIHYLRRQNVPMIHDNAYAYLNVNSIIVLLTSENRVIQREKVLNYKKVIKFILENTNLVDEDKEKLYKNIVDLTDNTEILEILDECNVVPKPESFDKIIPRTNNSTIIRWLRQYQGIQNQKREEALDKDMAFPDSDDSSGDELKPRPEYKKNHDKRNSYIKDYKFNSDGNHLRNHNAERRPRVRIERANSNHRNGEAKRESEDNHPRNHNAERRPRVRIERANSNHRNGEAKKDSDIKEYKFYSAKNHRNGEAKRDSEDNHLRNHNAGRPNEKSDSKQRLYLDDIENTDFDYDTAEEDIRAKMISKIGKQANTKYKF